MNTVGLIFGWFFTVLFFILAVSMILMGKGFAAFVLLVMTLLSLPQFSAWLRTKVDFPAYPWARVVVIFLLFVVFTRLLIGGTPTSIYKSPAIEERMMALYDEKMQTWPVEHEDLYVETQYGTVHVIASGEQELPPLMMLHASGVAGWSWKYNAEGLSQHFRIYAVDLIGDAGKSKFDNLNYVMKTGRDQAELYDEIMEGLAVEKAYVVGASEGGFIASNLAMYKPHRVEKLALLGPMGYSGATQSIMRITFAQFFPLAVVHNQTFRWAFSDHPVLKEDFTEWFHLIMGGTYPVKVPPMPFRPEERQQINVPTMMVLGARDHLVGDPDIARQQAGDIPEIRFEVLDAGHLMAAELPHETDSLLLDFFEVGEK